ncbi:MAG: hypothetical protein QME50_04030, partial [Candidatus Bathyarchaeota archaeon]|nr:hypothetical protein [Candidatus Bathyarchaeota archaeon]
MKTKIDLKKTIPILTITILLISTIAFLGIPVLAHPAPEHTATVSPAVTTVPTVAYAFNVTCVADNVNRTYIILPGGFTYIGPSISGGGTAAIGNWSATYYSATRSVNFTALSGEEIAAGKWAWFNFTVKWPSVPPTPIPAVRTFGIDCFLDGTASQNNTVTLDVSFIQPQHTASIISPAVANVAEVTYNFNVTCKEGTINGTSIILPSGSTYLGKCGGYKSGTGANWTASFYASTSSVNFTAPPGEELQKDTWGLFNVSVRWPGVPPTTATFGVDCYIDGTASLNNTKTLTATFNPQFSATITPTHVKGDTTYLFNITTVNVASSIGLGTINITYPSGWTFNALVSYGGSRPWPTIVHDADRNTFKLTGPNLLIGEYVWIQVNMTTTSTTMEPDHWNSTAWDTGGTLLGTYDLPVIVDAVAPTVTITKPADGYYSVGFGNRIWINATVTDNLNITKYGITVGINDTARFEYVTRMKTDDYNYTYCFANKTAISDGVLAVKITATDKAGNMGSGEKSTTVDNTAPKQVWVKVLDQGGNELPFADGVYWMGVGTTGINVSAAFYNPAGLSGFIYLNTTQYTFQNETATSAFDVTGSDYVILKITLIDGASPTPNNFTQTWEIKRDKVKPSTATFTAEAICGGAIIRALEATDNVGVLKYKVYINGTPIDVPLTTLNAADLKSVGDHRTFVGILVLNLTVDYAGKVANITISAVDYGANEGNSTTVYLAIPEGEWYPVELYKGWNL